ncbi:MAG: hypothetical protein ABI431_00015 [Candidatus Tumulicola sp.]
MTYASESAELDADILAVIDAWHTRGVTLSDEAFDDLALRLFDYQRRYNLPYARYCAMLGWDATTPRSWDRIPAVPAAAFKEGEIATFPVEGAVLTFETSGTTDGHPGNHYFETNALYDAALLAGFQRFMLGDGARLRYCNVVPNPSIRPQSSLGYMMRAVAAAFGDGEASWYVQPDRIDIDRLIVDLHDAARHDRPVCIATTAFALVALLDRLEELAMQLPLPHGSRVMETGGFKGRTRTVDRDELYRQTAAAFELPDSAIVAEYGMTELTSQYYDGPPGAVARAGSSARYKYAAPWLRARVVGPDERSLADGVVGALVHVDLANRASCIAIATEDLGASVVDPQTGDVAIVLIGRERGAELRGCSLDAETLRDLRP